MSQTIDTIGILGGGQMGTGIAQVALQSGFSVRLVEKSERGTERARSALDKGFGRLVRKGRMTEEEVAAVLERLSISMDRGAFAECGLVVEAVSESPALKRDVFAELDGICSADTILATNTSSISITWIASATQRPESVIGMHFMNPVPAMALVELIRGLATSDDTHARTAAVCDQLGKTVVTAADYPGFIVNRILIPMINEACYALMEGVGSAEDIDNAMKLGTNQPMGPLALADLIGLDTCLAIMEVLQSGLGDAKYRPCPLLRKHVDAGYLGRKTGRGFHRYDA